MKVIIVDTVLSYHGFKCRWLDFSDHLRSLDWVESCDFLCAYSDQPIDVEYMKVGEFDMEMQLRIELLPLLKSADDDTIFVFTNAMNSLVIKMHEYRSISNKGFKMIGFWNDISRVSHGMIRKIYRPSDLSWLKQYEKSVAYCYDYNLYTSEMEKYGLDQLELSSKSGKLIECPYPFDISFYKSFDGVASNNKSDIAIFTDVTVDEHNKQFQDFFRKTFKNLEFYNINSPQLNIDMYMGGLNRAKVVVSTSRYDINPYSVIEAMAYGCYPLLPDIKIYKKLFQSKYLYNRHILKPPLLNFVRKGKSVFDIINNLADIYDREEIRNDAKSIVDKFYSSDKFKKILCQIN